MEKITQYLVIHCTATPAGREVSSTDIRRWHTSPAPTGRGWKQVGYTDMIHLDGTIERLVPNDEDAYVDGFEITNGVAGMNSLCRHIVYVGGLSSDGKKAVDTRTAQQMESLKRYVLDFHRRFPKVKIVGHNQLSYKECPSFDVSSWTKSIGI